MDNEDVNGNPAKAPPDGAEIRNDMIRDVRVRRERGTCLCLDVRFESRRSSPFICYMNTDNLGNVLLALAGLLGVDVDGESDGFLSEFRGTPCRIATVGGGTDGFWIGHFMSERWMAINDIVFSGLNGRTRA